MTLTSLLVDYEVQAIYPIYGGVIYKITLPHEKTQELVAKLQPIKAFVEILFEENLVTLRVSNVDYKLAHTVSLD